MKILIKQIREAKRNSEFVEKMKEQVSKFQEDYPTCWMCWIQLTGQDLQEWRDGYSDNEKHAEVCDLCGYSHWTRGSRWFPFKWLRWAELGNPSSRFRFDDSGIKRKKYVPN